MSVHRPGYFDHFHRLQPIYKEHNEEDSHHGSRNKKGVNYQGRSWKETEQDLSIFPTNNPSFQNGLANFEKPPIYADAELYKQAKKQFEHLTTLQEKVAQICFYLTEASYDQQVFQQTKKLIQTYQIGGLLFIRGEYKRQTFLIEYYQTLSKTPLLIGNDFYHGLSFFLPESLFRDPSEKRYYDLGKVIMLQNLRMGIHFQSDQTLFKKEEFPNLTDNDLKAFRKGIRAANGIVGKFQASNFSKRKRWIPHFSLEKGSLQAQIGGVIEDEAKEILGLKTIELFPVLEFEKIENSFWLDLYHQTKEFILVNEHLPKVIEGICQAVQEGLIKEEDLDRRVFKALMVKCFMNSKVS